MAKSNNQIMFTGIVQDIDDPKMLGRIRVYPENNANIQDVLKGYAQRNNLNTVNSPDDIKPWTPDDPFVTLPFLPMYISQVPRPGELVWLIYVNEDYKYQDIYYVQGPFSSPMSLNYQNYQAAKQQTALGDQVKPTTDILNEDGTYKDLNSKGIFPEPGDNSLLGRGNSDVVVKYEDVLIRAGKSLNMDNPNTLPTANVNRAFLQVSSRTQEKLPPQEKVIFNLESDVSFVNYLMEWDIDNPENSQNVFNGSVKFYKLKQNERVLSNQLNVNSEIDDLQFLIYQVTFKSLSLNGVASFISDEINKFNDGFYNTTLSINTQFPFFFRPNKTTNKWTNSQYHQSSSAIENEAWKNVNQIYKNVKYQSTDTIFGSGLMYQQGKIGKPQKITRKVETVTEYRNNPQTFGIMGGDKIVLLSHKSSIPGKERINLIDTLYGIDIDKLTDDVLPNTSSMVRGEELIELLNIIVRYMISHVHAMPGSGPVPVSLDGTQVNEILKQLNDASQKVLNTNIRLNWYLL